MNIDLEAYMAGLMLPVEYTLGLLAFMFPKLRFSLSEYLKRSGYSRQRTLFMPSFLMGVVSSVLAVCLAAGYLTQSPR